ncbi:MAG TPA: DUF2510 domain-containing protein [Nitriliruptorales bacterium]|nr:DUF2510 domain-containing protein [Nitriliruptorales bacterium]
MTPEEAAGWRTDPTGRFEQRFHDGRRWTSRVRVGAAEAVESDVAAPAEPPARWHPDPTGRFEERLYNGRRWTKLVRVRGAVAIDIAGVTWRQGKPAGAPSIPTAKRPPGWYVDPDDVGTERFWDGYTWTAKARPAGRRSEPLPAVRLLRLAVNVALVFSALMLAIGLWVVAVR